jgi:hypothetical protein
MARKVARGLLALAAAALVVAIGVGVGLAVINLLPSQQVAVSSPSPSPAATATPPALPSPSAGPGNLIAIMPQGDCTACHKTPGNAVDVPPLGHPLEGWGSCTSCHANDRLVKTAPGHSGIHADQCLVCHTATTPAAEDRPDPGEQLLEGERLGQVVVRAGFESLDPIVDVAAGREHQHADIAGGSQAPADLEPVEAREHPVEDDEVRLPGSREIKPDEAVPGRPHVEPLIAEPHLEELAHGELVVDDEHPRSSLRGS